MPRQAQCRQRMDALTAFAHCAQAIPKHSQPALLLDPVLALHGELVRVARLDADFAVYHKRSRAEPGAAA